MASKDQDTLYARWLSGDLSQEELNALKSSGELEQLKKIAEASANLKLPEYNLEKEYKKLRSNRPVKEQRKTLYLDRRVMALAASLLIILSALYWFRDSRSFIEASNKETLSFQFSDGSNVVLNDGSSLKYNESTWNKQRFIELKGEAIFDVEKGNPFIVATGNGQVEVLGTSFNVRSWGDQLLVECYEGRVRVSSQNEQRTITANQSVIFTGKEILENQIGYSQPNWLSNRSKFNSDNLSEVLNELSRQYDVSVDYEIEDRLFTGIFTHENLDTALNEICKPLGLQYTISSDGKSVYISE